MRVGFFFLFLSLFLEDGFRESVSIDCPKDGLEMLTVGFRQILLCNEM